MDPSPNASEKTSFSAFLFVFGLGCIVLALIAPVSGSPLVGLFSAGFAVVFLALRRIINCNQDRALLPRSALWLLGVLFLGSGIVCVVSLGLSVYMLAVGISDEVRFHTPDNLALGIAFGLFITGAVPSFLVAFFTGRALWKDRKERTRGHAA